VEKSETNVEKPETTKDSTGVSLGCLFLAVAVAWFFVLVVIDLFYPLVPGLSVFDRIMALIVHNFSSVLFTLFFSSLGLVGYASLAWYEQRVAAKKQAATSVDASVDAAPTLKEAKTQTDKGFRPSGVGKTRVEGSMKGSKKIEEERKSGLRLAPVGAIGKAGRESYRDRVMKMMWLYAERLKAFALTQHSIAYKQALQAFYEKKWGVKEIEIEQMDLERDIEARSRLRKISVFDFLLKLLGHPLKMDVIEWAEEMELIDTESEIARKKVFLAKEYAKAELRAYKKAGDDALKKMELPEDSLRTIAVKANYIPRIQEVVTNSSGSASKRAGDILKMQREMKRLCEGKSREEQRAIESIFKTEIEKLRKGE
jgi:hypothetical protein